MKRTWGILLFPKHILCLGGLFDAICCSLALGSHLREGLANYLQCTMTGPLPGDSTLSSSTSSMSCSRG